MPTNNKIIMAWSKCLFEIGHTGDNDAMATSLASIGKIKDKSSSLETSDGDSLEMKATGGELVARETNEGGFKATTRVIEPTDELLTLLGLGAVSGDDFNVQTHIVDGDWSLKITPKNAGAVGIKAPKTNITYKPGWSEEDGNYADIDFEILKGDAGYWYSRFKKKAVATPVITATGNSIAITCATSGATIEYKLGNGNWTTYSSAITVTSDDNDKTLLARASKGGVTSAVASHTVAYSA